MGNDTSSDHNPDLQGSDIALVISLLVPPMSFHRETCGGLAKYQLYSQVRIPGRT